MIPHATSGSGLTQNHNILARGYAAGKRQSRGSAGTVLAGH
jgi:hypothetical protein